MVQKKIIERDIKINVTETFRLAKKQKRWYYFTIYTHLIPDYYIMLFKLSTGQWQWIKGRIKSSALGQ